MAHTIPNRMETLALQILKEHKENISVMSIDPLAEPDKMRYKLEIEVTGGAERINEIQSVLKVLWQSLEVNVDYGKDYGNTHKANVVCMDEWTTGSPSTPLLGKSHPIAMFARMLADNGIEFHGYERFKSPEARARY